MNVRSLRNVTSDSLCGQFISFILPTLAPLNFECFPKPESERADTLLNQGHEFESCSALSHLFRDGPVTQNRKIKIPAPVSLSFYSVLLN